jgi:hypothetical protein
MPPGSQRASATRSRGHSSHGEHVPTVGIIVNPWAGKDVRRLHAPVGNTPDTAKVGIVRRVVLGAFDAGAEQVVVADDLGRIGERAIDGIQRAHLVEGPSTGSALDTRRAATQLGELACEIVVVLGGDGTCRDVAIGWPDVTMLPISTGTNNVFPVFVDGSSAGVAAGLLATGRLDAATVVARAKRLTVDIEHADGSTERDIALVDVAAIAETGTGARAVVGADTVRGVVAAIASPVSTGLSSIAGRTHPLSNDDDDAVVVRLAHPGATAARHVRVPLVPGAFSTVGLESVERLAVGERARFDGPIVLAYDGERDRVLADGAAASVAVDRGGPRVLDVHRALRSAAELQLFDATIEEARDGD